MIMNNNIFIAGHNGMVGSAIFRKLSMNKKLNLIVKDRKELDLCNQSDVNNFFSSNNINQVYLCAAKVGGIHANSTYQAEFLYQNLMIQSNVIDASYRNNVKKLLFLGSSCIYPRLAKQPIKEEYLMSGPLELTNEAYAIAKISGLKLCEYYNKQYNKSSNIDYRSVMPTNLYGPGDNYDLSNSHVIPALIRKFHIGKKSNSREVEVWGDGSPLREFMHVDDLADACVFYMNIDKSKINNQSFVNIGAGKEITIKDLAILISKIVGFKGVIKFNKFKPNGTPRKLMNSKRINDIGWYPSISLDVGLKKTYKDFLKNYE